MRWFIFLMLVFALLWYIRGIEEQPPPTAEESYIGGSVKALRKAEEFEKTYLEAAKERQKRMEEELEKGSGGS
jgi:hypothetical protein